MRSLWRIVDYFARVPSGSVNCPMTRPKGEVTGPRARVPPRPELVVAPPRHRVLPLTCRARRKDSLRIWDSVVTERSIRDRHRAPRVLDAEHQLPVGYCCCASCDHAHLTFRQTCLKSVLDNLV